MNCVICNVTTEPGDSLLYGEFKKQKKIKCHYFCLLFAADLPQKGLNGNTIKGIEGFLIKDIQACLNKSKNHTCKICRQSQAVSECSNKNCKTRFHFVCAAKNNYLYQFNDNMNIFCATHSSRVRKAIDIAVKRKVNEDLKQLKSQETGIDDLAAILSQNTFSVLKNLLWDKTRTTHSNLDTCRICFDTFENPKNGRPIIMPCCWSTYGITDNCRAYVIHEECLRRQAYTSGYKFQCPFCKNTEYFLKYITQIGIYVPKRHALWENSQIENQSLLGMPAVCCIEECRRGNDDRSFTDSGDFEFYTCCTCGSNSAHRICLGILASDEKQHFEFLCDACRFSQSHVGSQSVAITEEVETLGVPEDEEAEIVIADTNTEVAAEIITTPAAEPEEEFSESADSILIHNEGMMVVDPDSISVHSSGSEKRSWSPDELWEELSTVKSTMPPPIQLPPIRRPQRALLGYPVFFR